MEIYFTYGLNDVGLDFRAIDYCYCFLFYYDKLVTFGQDWDVIFLIIIQYLTDNIYADS